MNKLAIVYWSGTGNTQTMAHLIAQGAQDAGAQVRLFSCAEFGADLMSESDVFAFGCPSMGNEELEESEFEPMFCSIEGALAGKKIALFGSYGWGDGEWMRSWEDRCKQDGALLVCDSVIANESPDSEASKACAQLGKQLVKA